MLTGMADAQELVRWALFNRADESIIVLVVDDENDDTFASLAARENHVPSDRFGGVWLSAQEDDHWLVVFQLIEIGAGPSGITRTWYTSNIHRELLEAVLKVPHFVALMPAEIAGDATTADDMLPRLGGSIFVEVSDRSPFVEQILAQRDD